MFLHRLKLPRLALLFGAITRRAASVQVFASPDSLSTAIPIECRTALSNNITCPAPLINANRLLSGEATNDTFAEQYCDCSCTDSLKSWSSDVKEKCGNRSYPFNNDLNLTASAITEPLLWAQNVTCLTDKDDCSQYCLAEITSSTAKECSDCNFQYQASILGSKYGNRRVDEQSFTSLLSSCGANPSDYPHSTFTADPRPPYPTNFPVITCNMGDQYEVCEGDTCQSIADKFGVSLDRFLYQNGLDFQCSYLQIGSKVCITDCCELHTVAENETCRNILKGKSFGQTELVAWNPVLHRDCDNIGALKGRTICISPPGTNSYDVDINVTWNVTWTLPGPWIAGPTSGSDAPESALKGYWRAIPTLTLEGGGPATLIDDLKNTPTE